MPLLEKTFHPSPVAWEDQIIYFLLPDPFSDNNESDYLDLNGHPVTAGSTPRFNRSNDYGNVLGTDASKQHWREVGGRYVGDNMKGLTSKLGYWQRLGVTAIWLGPIFKQVTFRETYHGYGVQDFLAVEGRFSNRDDLRTLVQTAHTHGIYVILDIILNHSGDVFGYTNDNPKWTGQMYEIQGFRDSTGKPNLPFGKVDLQQFPEAFPNSTIWPDELQDPSSFTKKGSIQNWDNDPEFLEGDLGDLKDINLGAGNPDNFTATSALKALCEVYKSWIAFADIDGYRIDTVKHMGDGPTRYFASSIHEFTQSIGKENFLLIGEITGGRIRAFNSVESTGIDAALGMDDVQDKLEYMIKGYRNPEDYFDLFRNSLQFRRSHMHGFATK